MAREGAQALTAYVPLLQKYDLHLLEQCRSAQQLSEDLARNWLSKYAMRRSSEGEIEKVIGFFVDWDLHKSHGRSISAKMAQDISVPAIILKGNRAGLVRSLSHQYEFFFDKSPFHLAVLNTSRLACFDGCRLWCNASPRRRRRRTMSPILSILSPPPASAAVSSVRPDRYPHDLVYVSEVPVGRQQVRPVSIACAAIHTSLIGIGVAFALSEDMILE